MTEPNDTPNAAPSIDPAAAPTPTTEAGVGGVTAQATAGTLDPQPGAAPAAEQPAESQPPAADPVNTQEPTGQAPVDPAATPSATPGVTEADAAAEADQQAVRRQRAEVASQINAIEQIALFWGGETGTKIRNHVGKLRELLAL